MNYYLSKKQFKIDFFTQLRMFAISFVFIPQKAVKARIIANGMNGNKYVSKQKKFKDFQSFFS